MGSRLGRVPTSSAGYLERGSTLILYIEGLVERRGADLDEGLRLLQELANGAHRRSLDEICDLLLDARLQGEGAEDDITILALRLSEDDQ